MLRIEAENGARIDCERNDADSYHLQLLKDAGFIHSRMKEFPNVFYGGMEAWMEMRLTWEGTKFLDDVRKDATWWNVKELLFRKGQEVTFHSIKAAAATLLSDALKQQADEPRSWWRQSSTRCVTSIQAFHLAC